MKNVVIALMLLLPLVSCTAGDGETEEERYFSAYEDIARFTFNSEEISDDAAAEGIIEILAEHGFDMEEYKETGDKLYESNARDFLGRIGRINEEIAAGK